MSEYLQHFDWGMILLAVVCTVILLASLLRLDELLAAPRNRAQRRRTAVLLDRDGEPLLCDPDGRTWSRARHGR